jgi:protein SCO1/2
MLNTEVGLDTEVGTVPDAGEKGHPRPGRIRRDTSRMGDRAERVQPLFITVDSERDTPQVLAAYTAYFHPRIIGLTGSPALVARAAQNFNARYEKVTEPGAPPDRYHVDHSAGMYLLGPDGSYIRKFGYSTPAAEIAERIASLLDETRTFVQ